MSISPSSEIELKEEEQLVGRGHERGRPGCYCWVKYKPVLCRGRRKGNEVKRNNFEGREKQGAGCAHKEGKPGGD